MSKYTAEDYFSSFTQPRQQFDNNDAPENILRRIEEIESTTGHRMTDAEKQQLVSDMRNGGKFDITATAGPEDQFANDGIDPFEEARRPRVAAPVLPEKATDSSGGYWQDRMNEMGGQLNEIGQVAETTVGGLERSLGSALFRANDTNKVNPLLQQTGSMASLYKALIGGDAGELTQTLNETPKETTARLTSGILEDSQSHTQVGEDLRKKLEGRDWITREIGGGLIDAANSPTSAVSLIGGPAATIGIADQYAQSYYEARSKGISKEDAEVYAWAQAAPEAVSFIPAGKVLERVPGLGKLLKASTKKVEDGMFKKLANPAIAGAVQAAKVVGGEAGEEGFTQALQDAANVGFAHADMGKLSEFAGEQAPKSIEEEASNIYRASRAGAVMGGMGGAIEGVHASNEAAGAIKDRANQLDRLMGIHGFMNMEGPATETERQKTERAQDILDAAATQTKEEQKNRDFTDNAPVYSETQKADEEEAAFRTIERQRLADKLSQNPNVKVAPAKPVSPEEVKAEREQTQAAEAARVQRVEVGQRVERIRSRQELARKSTEAEAAAQVDSARQAEASLKRQKTIHENKIIDDVVAQNPDATPDELDTKVQDALAANPFVPVKATEKTEAKTAPVQPKAKETAPEPAPKATAPTGPVKPNTQSELDALSEQLGLPAKKKPATLAMKREEAAQAKADPNSYIGKRRRIAVALANRTSQTSTDVQNLAGQGKLVVAPNSKSVGLGDTTDAAHYDTATGKMYLYTDHIANPDDIGSIMMRAVHESGHHGQFNSREGRSTVMHEMFSVEKAGKAATKINEAAKAGNKLAQTAVEKSQAEGPNANYELITNFAGEVANAREGSTLGRVSGVARDIRRAGRDLLRKAGLDMDLTMNDIHTAAMQLPGEAVRTQTKQAEQDDGVLPMTGGKRGRNFKPEYKGITDQKDRYEFSDRNSHVISEGDNWEQLRRGQTVSLDEVLHHPKLFEEYPQAAGLEVKADPALYGTGKDGYYDDAQGRIVIDPQLLATGRRDTLHDVLLHETQHYIQAVEGFTPGTNTQVHESKASSRAYQGALTAYTNLIDNFDVAHAVSTLPPKAKEIYSNQLVDKSRRPPRTHAEQVVRFIEDGWAGRSTDRNIIKQIDKYHTLVGNVENARVDLRKTEARALDTYLRDEGEVEARNTEKRKNMTDEERKATPPLSTYESLAGVKPQNVLDTTKYIGRPSMIPAALAMRNPEKVTSTPEFKDWFKDSKVVNPDGSPKVVYHGTRAVENFDQWRSDPWKDLGMHFGDIGQANNPRFVEHPADFQDRHKDGYDARIPTRPSRIIPVYLSIQNPLRMDDSFGAMGRGSLNALRETGKIPESDLNELEGLLPRFSEDFTAASMGNRADYVQKFEQVIKKAGYDGIVYLNTQEPSYVEYGKDEYDIKDVHHADSYIVFDPTQIKSAIANNGEFDPQNPSILRMASPDKVNSPSLPFTRRIPPVVSAFLSSSAGSGRIAREIIEHAVASPAGERMIAEATLGDYRNGVAKLAKQRGVSEAAINKEIAEKLDAVDKREDNYDTNLAAFTAVAQQYGKAGDALIKFRKQADNLTFEMIRERVAQGTPMSTEERDVYTTMRNNLGRYAHRAYATHMGKGGKKFAKNLWSDYEKYKKANGDNVSPKTAENWKTVADAVQKIVDEHLVIPSDDDLQEMDGTDVKRLFDVWGRKSNPEAYSLPQMRSILSDVRDAVNTDGDVMQATAENIVKDIIGLVAPKSPVAKMFRGGKVDQSILKERAWITPEIRKVMGEITDPAMRLLSTIAKQTEFIARNQMLMELRDNVGPEHVQPPGPSGRPEVKGMVHLKGKEYGPMNNYFVSENLANLLSSHVQQLATFEQAVAMAITRPSALQALAANAVVQGWGNLAGKAKMLQIVGKPINFLINFMGGPRSMLVNGNLNPLHLGSALKTAGGIIAYNIDPSKNNEAVRRVTSAGVTDSAFVGEINAEVYQDLNRLIKEMQGQSPSKTLETLNKWLILAPKEAYAMMDVVYKIANFYQQADGVLPSFYKAEGIEKSQKQIDREAADIVNDTNVTYKRAAPVVKNLERYGITQFGTFFYEVFRSEVNNVKQAFKELNRAKDAKTAKGKLVMGTQGATRLSGQLTAWYLTGMAARMMARAVFGDDDDKEQKLRALLPDYLQNQDFINFGKDKDGKDVLFDWSRVDPSGPMTDMMRTVLNNNGDFSKLEKDVFDLYVAPRLGTRVVEALAATAGSSKKQPKPLVQEQFPAQFESLLNTTEKAGLSDNAVKAWASVTETFLPGIVSGWGKSNARPIMTDGPSTMAALATYGGARMYTLDNQRALNSASFDHNDVLKANRAEISQYFDNHPAATPDQVLNTLVDKRANEKETFDKLLDVYDGMKAMGHTDRDIAALLKKNHIAGDTIKDLKRGTFHFRSLSKKSVEGFRRNEIVGKTLEEKRDINAKWKNAMSLLDTAEDQMDEEN